MDSNGIKGSIAKILKDDMRKTIENKTTNIIYTVYHGNYIKKTPLKDENGKTIKNTILKNGKLVSKVIYEKKKIIVEKFGLGIIGTDFIIVFTDDIVTKKNNRDILIKGNKSFIGKSQKLQSDEKYISKIIDNVITNKQDIDIEKIKDNKELSFVLNHLGINILKIKKNKGEFNELRKSLQDKNPYNVYFYYKGNERVKDIDNSFVLVNDCLEKVFNENGIKFNDNNIDFTTGIKDFSLKNSFNKKDTVKGINVFYYKF